MGETLGEYLRRRRLETAAMRLIAQPDLPVLHVALAVGFGSAEAFARSFKARFGSTPTAWRARERERRAESKGRQAERKPGQAKRKRGRETAGGGGEAGTTRNDAQEVPMKVTIIDRKPVYVAYFRYVGPAGEPISEFWRTKVAPWMETNGLIGRTRYGVSLDDPGITAPAKYRYDACVEVPPDFTGTGKYLTTTLPGGKYAVARFEGTVEKFTDAWSALLRDWLPASGMQLDARPFFETYGPDSSWDPETGVMRCDLCVPVARL
jgi:AraC family transcriptional regulator